QDVQRAVQDARRPGLEQPMRTASGTKQGTVVFAGLLAVAILTGPAGPVTARAAMAVLLPVNAAVEVLKLSVNRVRPDGERKRPNSSFPSSHAANAAALALVLGARWRWLAVPLWFLAAIVAFSRMYLNRHFLSDVLFGMAIGVGLGVLTLKWLRSRGWTWHPKTP
ncbi:MAG: phosphatase PAP2 family protein, partial [Candidatus Eiseniibacteriota bacterium]